jgi:hypothetical protein
MMIVFFAGCQPEEKMVVPDPLPNRALSYDLQVTFYQLIMAANFSQVNADLLAELDGRTLAGSPEDFAAEYGLGPADQALMEFVFEHPDFILELAETMSSPNDVLIDPGFVEFASDVLLDDGEGPEETETPCTDQFQMSVAVAYVDLVKGLAASVVAGEVCPLCGMVMASAATASYYMAVSAANVAWNDCMTSTYGSK